MGQRLSTYSVGHRVYALFVTNRVCAEPLTHAVQYNNLLHANLAQRNHKSPGHSFAVPCPVSINAAINAFVMPSPSFQHFANMNRKEAQIRAIM